MITRARFALIAAISIGLLAGTWLPPSRPALDPAAPWCALLINAGCVPARAHDLAIRIERVVGRPPPAAHGVAGTARQLAEQIAHLAVGRHGLQLTPSQLDTAIMTLAGNVDLSIHERNAEGGKPPTGARPSRPPPPVRQDPGQPFTTHHARAQLEEWLPTPGPR